MKIWVTKYWSTKGIYPLEAENTGTYAYAGEPHKVKLQLKLGRDGFVELEDAVKYCNQQVAKKIDKLTKDRSRVAKMIFTAKRLKG